MQVGTVAVPVRSEDTRSCSAGEGDVSFVERFLVPIADMGQRRVGVSLCGTFREEHMLVVVGIVVFVAGSLLRIYRFTRVGSPYPCEKFGVKVTPPMIGFETLFSKERGTEYGSNLFH